MMNQNKAPQSDVSIQQQEGAESRIAKRSTIKAIGGLVLGGAATWAGIKGFPVREIAVLGHNVSPSGAVAGLGGVSQGYGAYQAGETMRARQDAVSSERGRAVQHNAGSKPVA